MQAAVSIERLGDARRMRLVAAEEGIPGVLWAVLVFGGVVTVGLPTSLACTTPGRTG